jgi:glycosyltransferase involved in cell wall biosynthesis
MSGSILVATVDIDRALPVLFSDDSRTDHSARVLVRLRGAFIGQVDVPFRGKIEPEVLAAQIWAGLGSDITSQLHADGDSAPTFLPVAGLPGRVGCDARSAEPYSGTPCLSIVIATRERARTLSACLATVLAIEYPADHMEVIVVDNGPVTDTTERVVRELGGTAPKLLRYVSTEVAGSAVGREAGWRCAEGEYVLFLDDDVAVDPHWAAAIAEAFVAHPGVDCVTGLVLPLQLDTRAQQLLEQFGGFSKGYKKRLYDLGEHRGDGALYPFAAGAFGSGANMAFRRSRLAALGGFDLALGPGTPTFGGEDIAPLMRCVALGGGLVYEPRAVVWHRHPQDYAVFRRNMYRYGVGLSAAYASLLMQHPEFAGEILRRVPAAIQHLLHPRSSKNLGVPQDYPRTLRVLQVAGLAVGPFAYARSRQRLRRATRRKGGGTT